VSSKFGVYKFLIFSETLAYRSNPVFPSMQVETFNHAESSGDVQAKQARSWKLEFVEN
jgi:hypothetical protein